jgi:phage N-6-adenine-methyltransferase
MNRALRRLVRVEDLEGIDGDAQIIGELYRKAAKSAIESIRYAIECGRALTAKKSTLAHGDWLAWLKGNSEVLGFDTPRTAQRLMQLGANTTLTSLLTETTATKALLELWGNDGAAAHHRTQFTGEQEWYTPALHITAVKEVLGNIDLDPASSVAAQQTVQAKRFFTAADNGLEREWSGSVWLNPPYAWPLIEKFVDKLLDELGSGRVTSAILLTNNFTDTVWFHRAEAIAACVCFTAGRIQFIDPDGNRAAPTQGQAFFYFGAQVARFKQVFSQFGFLHHHDAQFDTISSRRAS